MNKPKDMTPVNNKGQRHGLWKRHRHNGKIMYEGNYKNDNPVGLFKIL